MVGEADSIAGEFRAFCIVLVADEVRIAIISGIRIGGGI
jgi:hypothetical protein